MSSVNMGIILIYLQKRLGVCVSLRTQGRCPDNRTAPFIFPLYRALQRASANTFFLIRNSMIIHLIRFISSSFLRLTAVCTIPQPPHPYKASCLNDTDFALNCHSRAHPSSRIIFIRRPIKPKNLLKSAKIRYTPFPIQEAILSVYVQLRPVHIRSESGQ